MAVPCPFLPVLGLSYFFHSLILSIREAEGCFRFGVPTGSLNSSLKEPDVPASPVWRNLERQLKIISGTQAQGTSVTTLLSHAETCWSAILKVVHP